MGLEKCLLQTIEMSLIGNNTMGLKIGVFMNKPSFTFMKFSVCFLHLIWQNDIFLVFKPILPSSEKCLPTFILAYFWVISVGNDVFDCFPPHYIPSFSILAKKVHVEQKHLRVVLYLWDFPLI